MKIEKNMSIFCVELENQPCSTNPLGITTAVHVVAKGFDDAANKTIAYIEQKRELTGVQITDEGITGLDENPIVIRAIKVVSNKIIT